VGGIKNAGLKRPTGEGKRHVTGPRTGEGGRGSGEEGAGSEHKE